MTRKDAIDLAVDYGLDAHLMMGNVKEAIELAFDDYELKHPNSKELDGIYDRIDIEAQCARQEAGVSNPISSYEMMQINKAFDFDG